MSIKMCPCADTLQLAKVKLNLSGRPHFVVTFYLGEK